MNTVTLSTEQTIAALKKEVTDLYLNKVALLAYQDLLLARIVRLEADLAVFTVEKAEEVPVG